MARKEDMLPPGWEDLDRYVDLLFRLAHPLSALILVPPPLPPNLPVGVSPFTVERSCQSIRGGYFRLFPL